MSNWLEELKVGDKAIIQGPPYYGRRLVTVTRLTKTQVIVKQNTNSKNETKFRLSDGGQVGGDKWTPRKLIEATPERLNKISDEATIGRAKEICRKWERKLNYELAVKIIKLNKEHSNEPKE